MEVSLVPPEMIEGLWPRIFPHLAKASEFTFGRYEPEDIMLYTMSGDAHLWVVLDEDEIIGITVTRFWQYPRKRCLDLVFLGGDEGFSWKEPMLQMLRAWAQDSGCEAIEAAARPAFARVFKDDGYRTLWQVFELPVMDTGLGVTNG